MSARSDLIGQRFGRLLVVKQATSKNQKTMWECLCDCGNTTVVPAGDLKSQKVTSCKCYNREISSTHKMSKTKIYKVWSNMKSRCLNDKWPRYKDYGGRGITVCDKWLTFEGFYEDMHHGYEEGLSIDRIDVNGNYEPNNCKWSTPKEQSRNQRTNHRYLVKGEWLTINEIEERYNVDAGLVRSRLRRGINPDEALKKTSQKKPDNEYIKEVYQKVKNVNATKKITGYCWDYINKIVNQ